eukprot:SAG31_NODE_91_length_26366_cov_6.792211_19_plen_85_part_00
MQRYLRIVSSCVFSMLVCAERARRQIFDIAMIAIGVELSTIQVHKLASLSGSKRFVSNHEESLVVGYEGLLALSFSQPNSVVVQ